MTKDNLVYLRHIIDAANQIYEYIKDLEFESFIKSRLIQDAVIRELEIIGEASKNLTNEFLKNYPTIPWKDIAGMRDKLIHGYMGVNLDDVWKTTKDDVPALKDQINKILKNNNNKT